MKDYNRLRPLSLKHHWLRHMVHRLYHEPIIVYLKQLCLHKGKHAHRSLCNGSRNQWIFSNLLCGFQHFLFKRWRSNHRYDFKNRNTHLMQCIINRILSCLATYLIMERCCVWMFTEHHKLLIERKGALILDNDWHF